MIRCAIVPAVVVLAVLAGGAAAEAQPAPRVTLDVVVSPAPGLRPDPGAAHGRLAVGADGTYYVLLNGYAESSGARIELVAIGPGGVEKMRTTLPVRLPVDSTGFAVQSMGVAVSRAGDLAVVVSGQGQTALFRLGADGRLLKVSEIAPPAVGVRFGGEDYYQLRHYVATPDDALLLAGGYGSGPYSWWLGKFSLDGARMWQQGPSRGFPDSVNAVRARPQGSGADGSWIAILEEQRNENMTLDCFLDRYAADGRRLARARLAVSGCYTAVVLDEGSIVAGHGSGQPARSELVFLDDDGKVTHRTPWPFDDVDWMIADGSGLAAIVTERPTADSSKAVVRADARGALRWKSPAGGVSDIARTPDGRIAALVWETAPPRVRLIVYADP